MKIVTGRLVDDDIISTYRIAIWTAAYWNLSNTNLAQVLLDKAYESAGVKPSIRYTHEVSVNGGNKVDPANSWCYSVVIKRRTWEEVTK